MVLYDEEEIMRSYVESERNDAWYDSKIDIRDLADDLQSV